MANILQVTRPTPDIENRTLENRDPRNHINSQQIQNQVDPTRVVRADGQEKGGTGAAHDGNYSVIDYESNYGAFIQRLKDAGELPELLKQLLLEDSAGILFGNQESVAGLVEAAEEAVQALVALGYTSTEASRAVKQVEVTDGMTSEDVLKASLKHLSFL